MADKFDLVVIGAGPGGYEAAIEGVQKGMKVALVENRELGGTCLNRGCIPTKTIIHTAELYHELQSGPSIGLTVREPAVDMEMVQKRKDEVLEQLRKGIASLMKTNKISVYYGTGTILDRIHQRENRKENRKANRRGNQRNNRADRNRTRWFWKPAIFSLPLVPFPRARPYQAHPCREWSPVTVCWTKRICLNI